MPFDQFKLLAQQLKNLQTEVGQRLQGEPFEGFAQQLKMFQDELQNAGAEIAELDALEAQATAPPPAESVPTLDELLSGGENCRGIEHILSLMPSDPTPETFRPDIRTPFDVVERMLTLASVSKHDTVYDLGCGDGRIPVVAAEKFGARGVGIELLPERAQVARLHVQLKKLDGLVTIEDGNVLEADFSQATLVTLFISKGIALRLRDKLRQQLPLGARIVAHAVDLGDWRPRKTMVVTDKHGHRHRLLLWCIDERCKHTTNFSEDWEFWDDWSAAND